MPDLFGGDHAHTVANFNRCVKIDPITILTVMGMATERLGVTFSTTYFEPFHVARVFATLDLVTDGRAAWNIVTSMNNQEARNMGHASHDEHDRRYDRADKFLEAEDHAALIDALPKEIDSLSLLSEVLNFDFSRQPIDEAFTQEQLDSWTGVQGIRDRIAGTR